ncbi:MAG: DPP IV N-terminal domain-containing protein [Gemmatimonadota bacterium]|nr:DPP IV N-terminal domain-containing protein [Gemmatimonadota bacterium]
MTVRNVVLYVPPPDDSQERNVKRIAVTILASLLTQAPELEGQTRPHAPEALTASDYARAEQFVSWRAGRLTAGTEVDPRWVEDDRFWYRNGVFGGHEFILVDAGARRRDRAFEHDRLAAALSVAADTSYEADHLPFEEIEFVNDGTIRFHTSDEERWDCDIVAYRCSGPDSIPPVTDEIPSPDGSLVAFSRDENLWVREMATGAERQLSTDGVEHYGYGVVPEGCCSEITNRRRELDPPPILEWSPDGGHIATHRYDERDVAELHLLEAATGRPILHSYRYALPGDSVIPSWELHVFDPETGAGVRADVDPMPGYFTSADSAWTDVQWDAAGDRVFFTRRSRDFRTLELLEMDAATGAVRSILVETGPTYVEANQLTGLPPNWRVLGGSSEVVWFSERDGWGHLYLHDLASGDPTGQITRGSWLVVELLHVDETAREVYFTAVGRESGDPYRRHLYRASLDGGEPTRLTPEDADHDVRVSPGGRHFVDTYGTRGEAPVTVLRDRAGDPVMTVQEADIGPLIEAGWRPPVRFRAKARDGVTDVYGYLFLPSDIEEGVRYPVVDYVYPGPQIGPIRTRGFTEGPRGQGHALAELGFITFVVDAIGTPYRSKAFHDGYYGDMGDNGIPDHISALKQLALRYPVDLDRVGIFGHSGGGFASTDAILRYPGFFKVAVSGAGNHDNRGYHFPWGEKYQGLLERNDDGTDNYDSQANQNLAANLEGKLLLHYGTLDDNVHPNMTLLVAQELIEHNKDFDMLVFPNRNHGYAREPYLVRRTWDYFVRHLMGAEPPSEYELREPD